jgi:peptide-methionine (R)-S-oxide reductase
MMRRAYFLAGIAGALAAAPALARAGSPAYAVTHSDADWKRILGPDRYFILRQGGTEPPFSSPINGEKRVGIYHCAGCNLALFSSATKYDSGEGWPSFWNVLPNATFTQADYDVPGEERTELHCKRCGGHLGHIFDDGPPPTNLRYCIDGLALNFVPRA